MDKFSERLKELRLERKMSQQALSLEIGYSQGAIARWEAKKKIPNILVAIKIAQFFHVTTDYLLGLED